MTKESNSFKNITTMLLALLLLGIAAASATAESVPISTGFGTIKSMDYFSSSAILA